MMHSKSTLNVFLCCLFLNGCGSGGGGGGDDPENNLIEASSLDSQTTESSDGDSTALQPPDNNRTLSSVGDVTTSLVTKMTGENQIMTASIDFITSPTATSEQFILRAGRLRLIHSTLDEFQDQNRINQNQINRQ